MIINTQPTPPSEPIVTILTNPPADQVIRTMAFTRKLATLLKEQGEFAAWTDPAESTRWFGYSNWVAYLPSERRAVRVTRGSPLWFDALSLEDAISAAMSHDPAEMDHRN